MGFELDYRIGYRTTLYSASMSEFSWSNVSQPIIGAEALAASRNIKQKNKCNCPT
jgi:hypothetical protein